MTLIDDVLEAVADPESDLYDALYAVDTAATHLKRARARYDSTLGSQRVWRRAQDEVQAAYRLASDLVDDPFRKLFDVLLDAFSELDAYRSAVAAEALEESPHPIEGGTPAFEYAFDELEYAESIARKALAGVLAGELASAVAA